MVQIDFKTLLFAQSSTREQSSKKVWSELENEERDWGETVFFSRLKRLDIDVEGKKNDCFAVYGLSSFITFFQKLKRNK